ncbi:hypothetical protein NP83_10820 [Neobacillus niacini]|nr:hypothetical protein NP83_10820 [Neobacillus niacini]
MSFINIMKDKTQWEVTGFVLHEPYEGQNSTRSHRIRPSSTNEGQNSTRSHRICPSSNLRRTKLNEKPPDLSFINLMRDKTQWEVTRLVLHDLLYLKINNEI